MLAPLTYERVGTFSDPSEGPEGRLGSGLVDVAGPDVDVDVAGVGATTAGDRKLHPLHWLVDGHWLGRWRTPRLLKIWRYGAGSIVAFVTSVVTVYVCFSWIGLGASTSAIIAFFAGAIPNWVLNRRWAWQQRGREGVARETSLYVMVSIISLVTSTAVTKLAATQADHVSHLTKDFLVTGSYTFSIVVLTGLKYLAYDKLVFVDRSGARRSRHQVPSTTEQNRTP